MKKRNPLLFLAALWLGACQTDPDSSDPANYALLVGSWKADGDSASVLTFTQACCGEKAAVKGWLKLGAQSLDLQPRSGLTHYSIRKPEAGDPVVNTFALHLEFQSEGALCAVDGFLIDSSGSAEWPDPVLSTPLALDLAGPEDGDSACAVFPGHRKWSKVP